MSPLAVLEVKSSTHVPRGVARTSLHVPRWRASRIALHAPAKASILAEFSTMEPTQGLEQSLLLLAPAPGTIREGARRATARNCCCHTTAHAKTKRAPRTEEGYRPGVGVFWSLFCNIRSGHGGCNPGRRASLAPSGSGTAGADAKEQQASSRAARSSDVQ